MKAFVRVKAHVQAKVEAFWSRQMGGCRWVLGVHVRGTDKNPSIGGGVVPPEAYYPLIDRHLGLHQWACVFAATDQSQFAEQLKGRYGSQLHLYHALRSNTSRNVFSDPSVKDHYRKGEDALVEALLLARCDFLLKPHSGLSEAAIFFNLDLHNNSVEMQYHGSGPPAPGCQ